jgi:putative alpha-1,2-mannosidase
MGNTCVSRYAAAAAILLAASSATAADAPSGSLASYVNTLRGSQNSGSGYSRGNTFPAALRPWGFNFWTPITAADSDRWLYDYDDTRIAGFSISHEPSPWIGDYGAIQFFPQTGSITVSPGSRAATFTHANETARAHFYGVLFDNGIRTEIAPTDHAAKVRFTFPAGNAYVTFDAVSSSNRGGKVGYSGNSAAYGFSTLRGQRLYFYARFDRTFTNPDTDGDSSRPLWGSVQFGGGQAVVMDIGTSFISVSQAKRSLEDELGGAVASKTFAAAVTESENAWNTELGRFQLGEADDADRFTTFYSNLYRSLMYPNSRWEKDASGHATYCSPFIGFSQPSCSGDPLTDPGCRCDPSAVKTGTGVGDPAGGNRGKMYVNNGFWDTYHAEWPLLTLVYKQQAVQMLQGFINTYLDGGWTARWTGPGYQHSMLGTLTDVVWADAYVKGVISSGNANVGAMYEAMVKDATVVAPDGSRGRQGNDHSIFLGWVGHDRVHESGSWHLEDRNNDWGIAQVARLMGRTTEAAYFRDRALDYVHLFSPTAADKPLGNCESARDTAGNTCGTGTTSSGFFRGRNRDGTWRQSDATFYPQEWGHEFSEGAPWHYALAAAHDPQGMANLYGGRAAMAAKIDTMFAANRNYKHGGYGGTIHEMAEAWDANTGQYAHINEPIHNTLYMYNYAGWPAKTARHVRDMLDTQYVSGRRPGEGGHGYRGDEDNGEMSAWYVLSASGIFPASPAHPVWTIGTPLFSRVRITPQGGSAFTVCTGFGTACSADPSHLDGTHRYVDSATFNAASLSRSYLTHAQIAGGGTLVLSMTGSDTSAWGTAVADLPPSITTGSTVPSPAPDRASGGMSSASASVGGSEDHTRAFDDTSDTKWLVNESAAWIQYEFPGGNAYRIDTYTLTSGSDAPGRDPRRWTLSGSNDGATWTTVDTESSQTWTWRRQTRVFGVGNPGAYRYYRLDIEANNGDGMLQLAEIELLNLGSACQPETDATFCARHTAECGRVMATDNCGATRTVASCGGCAAPLTCGGGGLPNRCGTSRPIGELLAPSSVTADGQCAPDEAPQNAADGLLTTKWCALGGAGHWLQYDFGRDQTVQEVRLSHAGAGGETAAWNTADYTIETGTNGTTWTTVAAATGNMQNQTTHVLTPATARYVKFNCTTCAAPGTSNTARLYEMSVYGAGGGGGSLDLTEGGTAVATGNACAASEDVSRLYDNSFASPAGSKWCVFAAPSAAAPVSAMYDFAGSAAHVVGSYRMTTANDAAGRDPAAWKLQGCRGSCTAGSDAGWIDIDARSGQFAGAARFQTNTYSVANGTAYQQYRLRVTANNGDGGSFQMAELQLFGATGGIERTEGGTSGGTGIPCAAAEDVAKLFDNLSSSANGTKWCVRTAPGAATPIAALYDFAGPTAHAINRYRITTANDAADRDPRDWKLQGCQGSCSVGSDAGWTDVDTRVGQFPGAARFQTHTYTFSNATAYQQYRLRVTANNGHAALFQIGELELFDGP